MGERRISANQNVALRLKAKKSSKKPRFFFSAAKHLERPHRYWTFRGKGSEISNPVRGRKLMIRHATASLDGSEINNPVRGRKHCARGYCFLEKLVMR